MSGATKTAAPASFFLLCSDVLGFFVLVFPMSENTSSLLSLDEENKCSLVSTVPNPWLESKLELSLNKSAVLASATASTASVACSAVISNGLVK